VFKEYHAPFTTTPGAIVYEQKK